MISGSSRRSNGFREQRSLPDIRAYVTLANVCRCGPVNVAAGFPMLPLVAPAPNNQQPVSR